jgi:hypothetical protein
MSIDRDTAMQWWKYLDAEAHNLQAAYAGRPGMERRTTTNPLHTADCLKGDAMLCAADVDEMCVSFAITHSWPNDLTGDQVSGIQLRLGCAKLALDYMTSYPGDEKVIAMQSFVPNPDDEPRFIEWFLIPVWRLFGELFIEDKAKQLQTLLAPGELERLWAENPPLTG